MIEKIEISSGEAVFGTGEYTYQRVLDDFPNAKYIGVLTFNISSKANSNLLNELKKMCHNGTDAVIITNIPKHFPSYFGREYAFAAKKEIDFYKQQLNPEEYGLRLSSYFTFHNHAKIIMTDNIIYWGSSNYSDESSNNFECGTISTEKALIDFVKDTLIPGLKEKSVPYYMHNFAVAITNLEELIPICQKARGMLFDAAFEPWSDYDTNFEEKWIYRKTESEITVGFLRRFVEAFSKFENALSIIDSIIDGYSECDELPEDVDQLKTMFDEYNRNYDLLNEDITTLFEGLEKMANYDVTEEASRKISDDYGMEAYDENLDRFVNIAMQEATEEYGSLIEETEPIVNDAISKLDEMIVYFGKLRDCLLALLQVNHKIDNTNVSR